MGAYATTLLGPIPAAGTVAFDAWRRDLRELRAARSPVLRATVRYVATAGNDAAAGTIGAPWATVAKVNAYLATVPAGNVAILFNRGDVWSGTNGVSLTIPNVAVGAYGTGARPFFDRFSNIINAAAWTKAPGTGQTYYRAVGPGVSVAWVRRGVDATAREDGYLARAASVAEVDAALSSGRPRWYFDNALQRIYAGRGVDDASWFSSVAWAWVEDQGGGGGPLVDVGVGADFWRVDSLEGAGWGMSPSVPNNIGYSIRAGNTGTSEGVVSNCRLRYGPNHVMGAYTGSSGGISTWLDNAVGCAQPGGGGLFVVSYATSGGQEANWYNTTIESGEAPTVGGGPTGSMAGAHTGGGGATQALIIYEKTRAVAGPYQAALPSGMTDTTETTGFVIDDVLKSDATSVGQVGGPIAGAGFTVLRPQWHFRVATGASGTVDFDTAARTGPVLGGWVTIDLSGWAPSGFQRINLINYIGTGYTARFVGTRFDVSGGTAQTFVFDLRAAFGDTRYETFEGCVFTFVSSGAAGNFLLPNLFRNAYYGVAASDYAADPHAVTLIDLPPAPDLDALSPASPLYRAWPLPPNTPGVAVETDLYGRRRDATETSLGPVAPAVRPTLTAADVIAAMSDDPPGVNVVEVNGEPASLDTGGGSGGTGTGSGDFAVNHDGGIGVLVNGFAAAADCMRFVSAGAGVDNVELSAFLQADYDAGERGASDRRGTTYTGSDGRWEAPLMLDNGTYTIVASKGGYLIQTLTVVVP